MCIHNICMNVYMYVYNKSQKKTNTDFRTLATSQENPIYIAGGDRIRKCSDIDNVLFLA